MLVYIFMIKLDKKKVLKIIKIVLNIYFLQKYYSKKLLTITMRLY